MEDTKISEEVLTALNKVNLRFGDLKDKDGNNILSSNGKDPKNDLGAKVIDDYIKAQEDNDLAGRDPLTGLHNRRYLEDVLNGSAEKRNKSFAIAMIDIDHFKDVNDIYGHAVGDEVLKVVADVISQNIRPGDIEVRWGGEEFIVYLPRIDNTEDLNVAVERLRESVENKKIGDDGPDHCSVSIGATLYSNDDGSDWKKTLQRADSLMYEAKQSGRNQVRVS